jgi:hypothetical protein
MLVEQMNINDAMPRLIRDRCAAAFSVGLYELIAKFCAAGLSALLLASCDENDSGEIYKVGETHIQIERDLNEAFWYDDHTLVFSGIDNGPESLANSYSWMPQVGYDGRKSRIFVWKLGEVPRVYRPELQWEDSALAINRFLCAAKGRIYYSTSLAFTGDHITRWSAMVGMLGNERATTVEFKDGEGRFPIEFYLENGIDRRCEQIFAPAMVGRNWRPSWRGDALLDLGRLVSPPWTSIISNNSPPEPIVLRDSISGAIIPVRGINPSMVLPVCSVALPWDNTFAVWRCSGHQGAKRKSIAVWQIRGDGSSIRTEIDLNYLVADEVLPFRDGYFASASGNWDENGQVNPNARGTYIFTQTGWRKVLGEGYEFRSLSPNGCLAAFATKAHLHTTISPHLSIFDLCKAKRN